MRRIFAGGGDLGEKGRGLMFPLPFFAAFDVYVSGIYFAVQRYELNSLDVL